MKKRFILCCLIIFLMCLFIDSTYVLSSIISYTDLFIRNLFPFLLLIFTVSSMLIDYGLLELLHPTLYVIFLSFVSGFPSSAKYSVSLYKNNYLDDDNALCLVRNCHYPNPLFLFGSISSVISKNSCFIIFISLIITSIIGLLVDGIRINNVRIQKENKSFLKSFTDSFWNSISTIVLIYGTSLFSFCIANIIIRNIRISGILYCLIYGLFDLTKGVFSTTLLINKKIREILILLFISMGSISIHMQVAEILRGTKLSYSKYLIARIRNTITCFIIYIILCSL